MDIRPTIRVPTPPQLEVKSYSCCRMQRRSQGGFPVARKPLLRSAICLSIACGEAGNEHVPSLGLCVPQAILEETPVSLLHIRDRNNQRHDLFQRKYVRLEREASGSHNSWNSSENASETISEGLKN